ncbi:DoxX family protein [Haloterrigena salina JCM 13891]|uniref:DoxX family protein n=1 Tax=Haloterrigena salina JCM 13891 TaxID=1227488 RepID=M0C754_9EURY|nr:DoxX family protein [Haloterrigena salina JCM 13891]
MDAPLRRLPTGRVVGQAALVAAPLVSASETARAHEEYVVDEKREVAVAEFLRESLTDPLVVGPLLAGALVVLAAVGGYLVVRPVQRDVAVFRAAMREYTAYVPWLLRISIGIPLIGAGFGGYLISPALGLEARLLQVALGFLLLFGLATRLVAVLTLAVYLVGLAIDSILLLQLEFVPGTLAIALLGGGRPSGDHVLQRVAGTPGTVYGRFDPIYDYAREFQTRIDPYRRFLPTIVRAGLGCTFVSLGLGQKLLRPGIAVAVVDRYDLTAVVPAGPELWVLGAGLSKSVSDSHCYLGSLRGRAPRRRSACSRSRSSCCPTIRCSRTSASSDWRRRCSSPGAAPSPSTGGSRGTGPTKRPTHRMLTYRMRCDRAVARRFRPDDPATTVGTASDADRRDEHLSSMGTDTRV